MCEWISACIFHAPPRGCGNFVPRWCGESCLGAVPIFEPAPCFNIYAACVRPSELRVFTHAGRHGLYMHVAHDPWCAFPRMQQDGVLKIDLVSGAEKVCACLCIYVSVCVLSVLASQGHWVSSY